LELEGLRRLEPRTVAVIYSIDPANAAIIGLLFLGERLTVPQAVGVVAVMIASAGATAATGDAEVADPPRARQPRALRPQGRSPTETVHGRRDLHQLPRRRCGMRGSITSPAAKIGRRSRI